jgi:hypothetical protein
MSLIETFKTADATIIGHSHKKLYKNNQDAYVVYQDEDIIVGVVCDGCGSSLYSEVGSRLCSRFIADYVKAHFKDSAFDPDELLHALLGFIKSVSAQMPGKEDFKDFIYNYFLFTVIGFVIKKEQTHIFTAGDGFVMINDDRNSIEQDNRPDYIACNILEESDISFDVTEIPTDSLVRLMIGSDGILEALSSAGRKLHDGGRILSADEMAAETSFFGNPVALPKYLCLLESTGGVLYDDTTLVVVRREND